MPRSSARIPEVLPRLDGRTVVVTGGTSGIGYFAAEQLAALGAHVVIAARNPDRAAAAIRSIRTRVSGADPSFQQVDLADLASVRAAGEALAAHRIDGLLANAGVIGYPAWTTRGQEHGPRVTVDGHELHWGTNHLGHFALVATLLPALLESGGRVVHVGSLGHRTVRHPADAVPAPDQQGSDLALYSRSKLAVMSFGFALARRLEAAGADAMSLVAHPGVAVDVLDPVRPGVERNQPASTTPGMRAALSLLAQGKDGGARPLVAALASEQVGNGDYWGPGGPLQFAGLPVHLQPGRRALDPAAGERLIERSERLARVKVPV